MASTRLTSSSPSGGLAQHVQPVADLHVLDLTQPAVDVHHELVERLVVGPVVQTKIMFQLGGLDQRPDLPAQGRHLGRVHGQHVAVLVEQLLQPGDVAVRLGPGHRRHQVVDDRGVGPALGLGALAGIVDQERIDQRQRADRGVGAAGRGHARGSCPAATPGCRACRGGPSRGRRTPAPPSGRRPGSGATAPDRDRGRSRSGSPRSRAAAGPGSPRCRPAGWRRRSRRRRRAFGRRTARPAPRPRPR